MIFYAHRLRTVLTHTVIELGLDLTLRDTGRGASLRENEAVIRETARLLGVEVQVSETREGVTATFTARR